MTVRFPGSFPVITDGGNSDGGAVLYGFVFLAPVTPLQRAEGEDQARWSFATATGYMSPWGFDTRPSAVMALLRTCRVDAPEDVQLADLDLMGVLHGLSERYDRTVIMRGALDYASSRIYRDGVDVPDIEVERAARRDDPEPMDRQMVHQVLAGLIGPCTADEVFEAYTKLAVDTATEPCVPAVPDAAAANH